MITIALPTEYSYVIGAAVLSGVMLAVQGATVGSMRKKLGVPLPYLYADMASAEKDKDKYLFNCYQRSHQNTLETYPLVLALLFIGGLKHPIISAAAGGLYILGRTLYAWGYQTGEPDKRARGGLFYGPAILTLLGTTISTALTIGKFI